MMNLSMEGIAWRFYLMMAGVVILVLFNQYLLATIWGFALAVSFILGISFKSRRPATIAKEEKIKEEKIIQLEQTKSLQNVG